MSVKVTTDVWKHSKHGGTELLILLKLADCADEETRAAYPSVPYLARHCRVAKRTVQYALKALRESGEIRVIANEQIRRPRTYQIRSWMGADPALAQWVAHESSVLHVQKPQAVVHVQQTEVRARGDR